MRYLTQSKEQYSEAFVRAIAAVAGVTVGKESPDINREDLIFGATADHGLPRFPKVAVQLKCTERPEIDNAGAATFPFRLDVDTYEYLRQEMLVPRILVVVRVPEVPSDWLVCDLETMTLRHTAYWHSLVGEQETENTNNITVPVSLENRFTPETLQEILAKINREESLR